jgi:XTP/dITP diphosphohydrolase
MMRLLLASRNAHKLQELRALLQGRFGVEDLGAWPELPEPPEEEDSFEGNALAKARFVHARTGQLCLADDSGLEVEALGGEPGVRSKRYSPEATAEANNALLLARLGGSAQRRARFVCALALVGPDGEAVLRGTCEGQIAHSPRGAQGFGYDPLFLPEAAPGRSMAELSMAEKNALSHRGRALARLPELLAAVGLPEVPGT